jgi:sugar lactone lactonase YvrE
MKRIIVPLFFLLFFIFSPKPVNAQVIRTVAGTYDSSGYTGDGGYATGAQIGQPFGVATDHAGNLYFSDALNHVVRRVSTTGIITTIAGTGAYGYNGDSIAATTAMLDYPLGVAVDLYNNVYIADNGNYRIRKVDTNGIITTVAGIGGSYGFGRSGDGGLATNAHIYAQGLAVDQYQNIYIADGNSTVRKVTHSTGIITTAVGNGNYGFSGDGGAATNAALASPTGVAVDLAGNIYVADYENNRVRMVNTAAIPVISTIAGTGTAGYSGDAGVPTSARLNQPYGVALDDTGNLYIADAGNYRIRKIINPTGTGTISTVVGNGLSGYTGDGGLATSARLAGPGYVCINPTGGILISDQNIYGSSSNAVIREITKPAVLTTAATPGTDICIGTPVTFAAVVSNPVLGERFQWQYDGTNVGTDTPFYANSSLVNGDKVSCTVYFVSASNIIAGPDTLMITVNPLLYPTVSIASDTNDICAGLPVTFSASSVNGGTSPEYKWQVNGVTAHIGSTYVFDPVNGDLVNCLLTSNAVCATPDTITSSAITMEINADVIMHLSVMNIGADTLVSGEMATFVAEATNEGSAPHFQWFVNGHAVPGATSNLYNTDSLTGSDIVTCVLTGSLRCTLPLTDTSAPLSINVTDLGIASTSGATGKVVIAPNPNNGSFYIKGLPVSYNAADFELTITNVLGQIVFTGNTGAGHGFIDLGSNLQAGLYTAHITAGTYTSVVPFVVKK